jgi:hypothetical protein
MALSPGASSSGTPSSDVLSADALSDASSSIAPSSDASGTSSAKAKGVGARPRTESMSKTVMVCDCGSFVEMQLAGFCDEGRR